ncbi:phosphatidylglycerophosphatase A [Rhodobacteraceae bacterium]|nr:phosphatidylglycerophosphatase A [Paracoccaceae bacterium]
MRRLFLSFFGAGYIRPAPGTWGSLAALPAAWGMHMIGGPVLLALGAAALYFAGVYATRIEIEMGDDHDPGWIVIDEVVGQWIALLPVSIGALHAGVPPHVLWPGIVTAFVLFRLFDISKPWLAGRADRRGDAVGVMLDDVWAGIFAALGGLALAYLSHGVLG